MTQQDSSDLFQKEILEVLDETFEKVRGIFLDGGTSLFETIAKISSEEASKPITASGTSIAAQVEHICFYLEAIRDYVTGVDRGRIDWRESWRENQVTDEEWRRLTENLRKEYDRTLALLRETNDWSSEKNVGGALAVIAHTAYHLGSIRQILKVARL